MPSGEGKSDMERLGVFKEMSYISIGDKYTSPISRKNDLFIYCLIHVMNLSIIYKSSTFK